MIYKRVRIFHHADITTCLDYLGQVRMTLQSQGSIMTSNIVNTYRQWLVTELCFKQFYPKELSVEFWINHHAEHLPNYKIKCRSQHVLLVFIFFMAIWGFISEPITRGVTLKLQEAITVNLEVDFSF